MATDLLSDYADEGSGYVVSIDEFTDEESQAITPTAISWTLSDASGNVVNSRDQVSVAPAASIEIGLEEDDTKALSGDVIENGYFVRLLLIEWTYNTTINGQAVSNYPGKKEVRIRVNSFVNVS